MPPSPLVGRAAEAYIRGGFGVFSLTESLDLLTHCASPPCHSPDQASPFSCVRYGTQEASPFSYKKRRPSRTRRVRTLTVASRIALRLPLVTHRVKRPAGRHDPQPGHPGLLPREPLLPARPHKVVCQSPVAAHLVPRSETDMTPPTLPPANRPSPIQWSNGAAHAPSPILWSNGAAHAPSPI